MTREEIQKIEQIIEQEIQMCQQTLKSYLGVDYEQILVKGKLDINLLQKLIKNYESFIAQQSGDVERKVLYTSQKNKIIEERETYKALLDIKSFFNHGKLRARNIDYSELVLLLDKTKISMDRIVAILLMAIKTNTKSEALVKDIEVLDVEVATAEVLKRQKKKLLEIDKKEKKNAEHAEELGLTPKEMEYIHNSITDDGYFQNIEVYGKVSSKTKQISMKDLLVTFMLRRNIPKCVIVYLLCNINCADIKYPDELLRKPKQAVTNTGTKDYFKEDGHFIDGMLDIEEFKKIMAKTYANQSKQKIQEIQFSQNESDETKKQTANIIEQTFDVFYKDAISTAYTHNIAYHYFNIAQEVGKYLTSEDLEIFMKVYRFFMQNKENVPTTIDAATMKFVNSPSFDFQMINFMPNAKGVVLFMLNQYMENIDKAINVKLNYNDMNTLLGDEKEKTILINENYINLMEWFRIAESLFEISKEPMNDVGVMVQAIS